MSGSSGPWTSGSGALGTAHAPVLLVACDFDGVLSKLVAKPELATLDPAAGAALQTLGTLERTHIAIVSGRGISDLRHRAGSIPGITLVGSHGAESDLWEFASISEQASVELDFITKEALRICAAVEGALVEEKPSAVAVHYRLCEPRDAISLVSSIHDLFTSVPSLVVREGHCVIEFSASPIDKGEALRRLRHRLGATSVLFIGDDETDEDGFAVLGTSDLGIRVGPGDTRATFGLADQVEVASVLISLAEVRSEWLAKSRPQPIERHALLSDQRTSAIVDPRGRLVWMCLPRGDSAAVFAELVGGPERGYFEILPEESAIAQPHQDYVGDTFILRTRWPSMTVTDYFDCSGGRAYQRAGRTDLLRVVEGTGRAFVRFAPRMDYGRMPTEFFIRDGGVQVEGSSDPCVLFAPGVSWRLEQDGPHQTAVAELDLDAGPVVLELRYGFGSMHPAKSSEADRRQQTDRFWSGWASTLKLPPLKKELVKRSALAIKALCYGPSGAIYAAATTSLPEHLGGVRNWDYRYCWPRDACLSAAALVRLGNTGVAMKLLDWIVGVVIGCESPDRLRPLYTVSGHELGQEGEIGELQGYGFSRPVRIGNAADRQVQLDVFGPIVHLVSMLVDQGAPVTPEHWRLVESMVGAVASRWNEPDHGIWEIRGPRRHHVHTKAMCWLAVDRGMAISEQVFGRTRPDWDAIRRAIRDEVLTQGWNENAGAYTTAFGSDDLDAAALSIGLCGMVSPDDPRFIATVEAVDQHLRTGPVVYRYRFDDGLPGIEGGFLICTSWLIEALVLIGRKSEAHALFEQMAELAGPTGLFAEEFDPLTRVSLGNFPQAYSHLGLINAALALS